MKQVVQLDAAGYFLGVTVADESPLEPGVFLLPAGTIEAEVPDIPLNHRAKWNGGWVFDAIPQPEPEPEPEVVSPTEQAVMRRHAAYIAEADPLFFKAQRGEATMQEWQAKVAEIKTRFPK